MYRLPRRSFGSCLYPPGKLQLNGQYFDLIMHNPMHPTNLLNLSIPSHYAKLYILRGNLSSYDLTCISVYFYKFKMLEFHWLRALSIHFDNSLQADISVRQISQAAD